MKFKLFAFLMLFAVVSIHGQDLSLGLVGYYSFCGCNANDHSGNDNNARLVGTPDCIDGINGEGFQFNSSGGTNDCGQPGGEYVVLPEFGPIWAGGISICAWVQYENIATFERIVDLGNGNGEMGGTPVWFGREGNSNNLTLESWVNTDGNQSRTTGRLTAQNAITNGRIEFYSATIENNTMKIYVNGNLVAEKQGNPILNVARQNNYIGRSSWCNADPDFKGFMDEVRVYNRALTAQEIELMYNSQFSFFGSDVTICEGESIELLMQGGVSYEWSPSQTLSSSSINNPVASPETTTEYTCTITFPDGCFVEESILVEVAEIPEVLVREQICEGLEYDGYTEAGLYVDTLTTFQNCDSIRTLELTVLEAPKSEETVDICAGEKYNGWSETGVYTSLLPAETGCDTIRTTNLTVRTFALTELSLTNTDCGDNAGQATFEIEGNIGEYRVWLNDAPRLTFDGELRNMAPGDYELTLIGDELCRVDTSFQIGISDCPVFIPSAFSPNKDGVNDRFKIFPKERGSVLINRFDVFSRWGELVYSERDITALNATTDWWDGTYQGKELDAGVFLYQIEVEFGDNIIRTFEGSIAIIR